jgi:anthranilate synthase
LLYTHLRHTALNLGSSIMPPHFQTQDGITISTFDKPVNFATAIEEVVLKLDTLRGAVFGSNYEYPGRYKQWDIGFYNPPLMLTCKEAHIIIDALNERGQVMLSFLTPLLTQEPTLKVLSQASTHLIASVIASETVFSEEERSQQPSVFSLIRRIIALFRSDEDAYLGLYGALGFDLIYQFEEVLQTQARAEDSRDMVLYFPDELTIVNYQTKEAFIRQYEFQFEKKTTQSLPRTGQSIPYQPIQHPHKPCDHEPGEYAALVHEAKERFACGDLFEVVPSQTFYTHYQELPSSLFLKMRHANPSPYSFFINLGDEEYLIGASPEMYVRVTGQRVETCPISGTIKRGSNAIEDARQIKTLLNSPKEESELTMCTDVDRNDKSRICKAGSVQVIGRRQIELYSRLIHTVDHVEGILRPGFDAVDAFLTHMWVVTVTGAPKLWALNFIEEHERSPRRWYAGAVGYFGFDGGLNTGLVLRTVRLKQGVAEVRVGATLLYDSIPEAEEEETRLKASAFIDLLNQSDSIVKPKDETIPLHAQGKKVLLIDHQDSFVHTLANYLRQTGAAVSTIRFDKASVYLKEKSFDLVVLSPGPGRPIDFSLAQTIHETLTCKTPLFGVCLGLQAIVEYFGGVLDVLDYPMHGKPSSIKVLDADGLFLGLPNPFIAGRYHSLYARLNALPKELKITAMSDDGVIMGIAHQSLPIHAVQFHPETIMSLEHQVGLKIISNLMRMV